MTDGSNDAVMRRTEGVPHDRLTRMCDDMSRTFDAHPEHRDADRCIVFLDDGVLGGLVLHGYDDDMEAMVDLLTHIRAVFLANGKTLEFIAVPNDASSLDG